MLKQMCYPTIYQHILQLQSRTNACMPLEINRLAGHVVVNVLSSKPFPPRLVRALWNIGNYSFARSLKLLSTPSEDGYKKIIMPLVPVQTDSCFHILLTSLTSLINIFVPSMHVLSDAGRNAIH